MAAKNAAERIGEQLLLGQSLLGLALTALRRHDPEAVRTWTPRALAAADGLASSEYLTGAKACLAWQDGHPEDVIKLANEIAELKVTAFGAGSHNSWVYLWPLLAAYLDAGQLGDATATCRQLLHPAQHRLPDDLESTVHAAAAAWEQDNPDLAKEKLAAALSLAHELHYF